MTRLNFLRAALLLAAIVGITSSAFAEKKQTLDPAKLPPAISEAIRKAYPDGEVLMVEQEVQGEDPGQYDIEVRSGGKTYDMELEPDGKIKEQKEAPAPGPKQLSTPSAPPTPPPAATPAIAARTLPSSPPPFWRTNRFMIIVVAVAFIAGLWTFLKS